MFPLTIPAASIVATVGLLLDQTPPGVVCVSVVDDKTQTALFPTIGSITGSGFTVKFVALLAVPDGVVTEIGPVVAPAGSVAVICVSLFTVKLAASPLKLTAVAPLNQFPVIVTDGVVPAQVAFGVKFEIVGAGL